MWKIVRITRMATYKENRGSEQTNHPVLSSQQSHPSLRCSSRPENLQLSRWHFVKTHIFRFNLSALPLVACGRFQNELGTSPQHHMRLQDVTDCTRMVPSKKNSWKISKNCRPKANDRHLSLANPRWPACLVGSRRKVFPVDSQSINLAQCVKPKCSKPSPKPCNLILRIDARLHAPCSVSKSSKRASATGPSSSAWRQVLEHQNNMKSI